MGREIRTVTTCLTDEMRLNRSLEVRLKSAQGLLDTARALSADLVVLPEDMLGIWDLNPARDDVAEAERKLRGMLESCARDGRCNLVAGSIVPAGDGYRNIAMVYDRQGNLAGEYQKHHPNLAEMERGIVPGNDLPVLTLDIGRVGISICFDLGWPDLFQSLAERGAEVVLWLSAYDGGFSLRTYAWKHQLYVVSAVRSTRSRIVDRTGDVLAVTSWFTHWASATLRMDRRILHNDYNAPRMPDVLARHGAEVNVSSYEEEAYLTLEPARPGVDVDELMRREGLETWAEYFSRSRIVRDRALGRED